MIALLIAALIVPAIGADDVSTELGPRVSTDQITDDPAEPAVSPPPSTEQSSGKDPGEDATLSSISTEGHSGSEPTASETQTQTQTTQAPAPTPATCGRNETYKENTPVACGELICGRRLPFCCVSSIVSQCFCKDGYQRVPNGTCVLASDCPDPGRTGRKKPCGPNEWKCKSRKCGEKKCGVRRRIRCARNCADRCFCKPGFFRSPDGTCVQEKNCPRRGCGLNEKYRECVSSSCAESQCGKRKPLACTMDCVHGCFCQKGFYRNSTGACVPKLECPKRDRPVFDPEVLSV